MKFSIFCSLLTVALSSTTAFAAPTTNTTLTDLESRSPAAAIEVASQVISFGVDIATRIFDGIAQDKEDRSEFTKQTVSQMHQNNPNFNYVICHTKHEYQWEGERGKDWDHAHVEFDIKIGGTIGYEIYTAKAGTFTIQGDGGYLNWAFIGNVKSDQPGQTPRTVVFNSP